MIPKVLFVDHVGEIGGAEVCLIDLAADYANSPTPAKVILLSDGILKSELAKHNVEVEVVAAQNNILSVRRNSGLYQGIYAVPSMLAVARQIARRARLCDVIYANSQKAFVLGVLASVLARRPIIWHLHDILTADHFSPTLRRLVVLLANTRANAVIANSKATAEAFVAAGGKRKLIQIVYNGVDAALHETTSRSAARSELLREIGCENDSYLIGSFSRLTYWKGQHVILDAVATMPTARLIIVGGALFGEGKYLEYLRKRVADLGITDRVHFLGFRGDVRNLMAAVDVVVHSSISPEPFGRVLIEAMLAQRPVIASAGGGTLEIIEHGANGLLITPGDSTALARHLQELSNKPSMAEAIAARGNAHASRHFSLESYLAGIKRVINQVCSASAFV